MEEKTPVNPPEMEGIVAIPDQDTRADAAEVARIEKASSNQIALRT